MKKIIWAAAASALFAGPALAADFSGRDPYAEPGFMPAAPAGVWSGFYLGGNIGLNFASRFSNTAKYELGGASGFTGGLQGGYDFQMDRFVLGVAGDINYSSLKRTYNDTLPTDIRASMNWNGSVRARFGYVVQSNFMVYATGGYAFGNVRVTDASLRPMTQTRMLSGWTAGVGGEYAFSRNWTAMLEYRYISLGHGNYGDLLEQPRVGFTGHQIRTGVNFRF